MEVVAHGLWAAAAAIAANRMTEARVGIGSAVLWAAFPDAAAFGPSAVAGLWLLGSGSAPEAGHLVPHVHIGLPIYPAVHSVVIFLLASGVVSVIARRMVLPVLGWLMHILIDIPTHSFQYYATRFLWPLSDLRVDGLAWWTPWLWAATYAALAVVFVAYWRAGWLSRASRQA